MSIKEQIINAFKDKRLYSQLMGVSGTGKGTRCFALIRYFIESGLKYEYITLDVNPQRTVRGIYFPEINLCIPGKFVKSNCPSKLRSWTGLDAYMGTQTTFDSLYKILETKSVICEGYVGWFNKKFSPDFLTLQKELPITHFNRTNYYYDNKEQLIERCTLRSGKSCKGDSAWGQNIVGIGICKEDLEWCQSQDKVKYLIFPEKRFDDPVENYGLELLEFLGVDQKVLDNFKNYIIEDKYKVLRDTNRPAEEIDSQSFIENIANKIKGANND